MIHRSVSFSPFRLPPPASQIKHIHTAITKHVIPRPLFRFIPLPCLPPSTARRDPPRRSQPMHHRKRQTFIVFPTKTRTSIFNLQQSPPMTILVIFSPRFTPLPSHAPHACQKSRITHGFSHQTRDVAGPGAIAAGGDIALEAVPFAAAAISTPEAERAPQHAAHYPGVFLMFSKRRTRQANKRRQRRRCD